MARSSRNSAIARRNSALTTRNSAIATRNGATATRNTTIAPLLLSLALAFAAGIAGGAPVSAHRLDEYLQAARVAISPDRVQIELDLTPGVSVAEKVLSGIDLDRDGRISAAEAEAYSERVLADLSLDLDGTRLGTRVSDRVFPAIDAMRKGEGTIRLRLVSTLPALHAGAHHLRIRNDHQPAIGAYLANALVPASDLVTVTNQGRDYDQRALDIDYVLRDQPGASRWRVALAVTWLFALVALLVQQKRTS